MVTQIRINSKGQRAYISSSFRGEHTRENLLSVIHHTAKEGRAIRARQKTDSFGSGTLYLTDKHVNQQYNKAVKALKYAEKQRLKNILKNQA